MLNYSTDWAVNQGDGADFLKEKGTAFFHDYHFYPSPPQEEDAIFACPKHNTPPMLSHEGRFLLLMFRERNCNEWWRF